MKKILLTLLGLGVLGTCQADVLVYKIKNTSTLTGLGTVTKDSVTGWIVIDPQNDLVTLLNVVQRRGGFQVKPFTNGVIAVLNGGAKTYTSISLPGDGFGTVLALGVNTTLITSTTTTWSAPKTMTLDGSDFVSNQLEQDKGTLSYDQTTTTTQNMLDGNFDNTVNRLRQILLNKGLTQF